MKRMNKVIAFSALAALTLGANSIQAGAYGETTEKSTLTADTKGVADYQTWKENTWTGKQSIDSGKIALTPGATEKFLLVFHRQRNTTDQSGKESRSFRRKSVYGNCNGH